MVTVHCIAFELAWYRDGYTDASGHGYRARDCILFESFGKTGNEKKKGLVPL